MTERVTAFRNGDLVFDVVDAGPLDGPVVVLLHGFPQRATSWESVTAVLNEHGYRTLAPDQRGYSRGARPRGRWAYRPAAVIEDVVALVEEIGSPVHLVGHDWGASVGWGLAATRPDLVRTLTAVSVPHPMAFLTALVRGDQARRSWYMLLFQLPFLPELGVRLLPGRTERSLRRNGMTEAMIARFRTEMIDDGALSGGLGWYRAIPFAPPGSVRRTVAVPTTYVWGDRETAIGRRAAELCGAWVSGPYTLHVLPGVNHWVPDQAADELAAIIEERISA